MSQALQLTLKGKEEKFIEKFPKTSLTETWKPSATVSSSIEPLETSDFSWGNKVSVLIPPTKGDYIQKMYLHFTLPALTNNGGSFASYTNTIGFNIFEKIELYIGETMITRKYSNSLEAELYQRTLKDSYDNMNQTIGRFDDMFKLQANAAAETVYTVPLSFWFTEDTKKAFPLFLVKNQDIRLDIYIRNFQDIVNYDSNTPPNQVTPTTFRLLVKFSSIENSLKQITDLNQKTKEIIIPIEQDETFIDNISDRNTTQFNGTSRGLFLFYRTDFSQQNNDYLNYCYNNNGIGQIQNILDSLRIELDGVELMKYTDEKVLRWIQPWEYYSTPNLRYIYYIPFSENIDSFTGNINFSVVKNQDFYSKLNVNANNISGKVFIINKRINYLKIFHNTVSLVFPY